MPLHRPRVPSQGCDVRVCFGGSVGRLLRLLVRDNIKVFRLSSCPVLISFGRRHVLRIAASDWSQGDSQKAVDSSLLFANFSLHKACVFRWNWNLVRITFSLLSRNSSHKSQPKANILAGFKGVSRRSQACSCWGELSGCTLSYLIVNF